MGVTTSEIGYNSATARRRDNESSYENVVALEKKKIYIYIPNTDIKYIYIYIYIYIFPILMLFPQRSNTDYTECGVWGSVVVKALRY